MNSKLLMIQGTGSWVGKSIIVSALCRIFHQDGWRVAPFKSQNMALNSFVTKDGAEMGRAQVVQAEAAGLEPHVDMNPILIKPEADSRSQVVVMGKPAFTLNARDYYKQTPYLLSVAMSALERLRASYELVIIEGAGSPVEINLREQEIVNMRVAKMAGAPVLLVGDIDKGGVFASLVGTLALLDKEDKHYIKGFIINKFRGDIEILKPGLEQLEKLTSVPVLGVVPYFHDILLGEEDSIHMDDRRSEAFSEKQSSPFPSAKENRRNFVPSEKPASPSPFRERGIQGVRDNKLNIAVIHLPHISNSTDFEPLQQETKVNLYYVKSIGEMGWPHLIIVPGSKSTISDLEALRSTGLAKLIVHKAEKGVPVMGICGGFQMLGRVIRDPHGAESGSGETEGLGLLDMETVFEKDKTTRQVRGHLLCNHGLLEGAKDMELGGYEIHMGKTVSRGLSPFCQITSNSGDVYDDGAIDSKGLIFGTYLHGLFDNTEFRRFFLNSLRRRAGLSEDSGTSVPAREEDFNRLASLVRKSLNMQEISRIIREGM